MIITSNHVTKQIAGAFVVKQVHDLWNALEWYSSMLCYTGSYVTKHHADCKCFCG